MKTLPVILLWVGLAMLPSCRGRYPADALLDELDTHLSQADAYRQRKEDQLELLRNLARNAREPQARAAIDMELGEAFFSYRYDSSRFYLNRCLELSEALGDRIQFNRAAVRLGHLDAKAGHFMEAYTSFFNRVDTLLFTPEEKVDYLYAVYDFCRDLEGNSVTLEGLPVQDPYAWRSRLFQMAEEDSEAGRVARIDQFVEEGQLDKAWDTAQALAATVEPTDRRYALYAYLLSDLSWRKGQEDEQLQWLVRSAESDLVNAVKDYASLTTIAQMMTGRDMDRAFRYMRVAQDDAIFYNGMLRPWQMSQSFVIIQRAYERTQRTTTRLTVVIAILLLALVLTLFVAFSLLAKRSRKLSRTQKELTASNAALGQKNRELQSLNQQITEAGRIKEVYIGRVLDMMSENVSKMQSYDNHVRNALKQGKADLLLKELSITTRTEDELQAFYRAFDSTFLALYPDYIEAFNALLKKEAQVYPKKGELLCTELRIFALIRLGIDDSVRIASLLHYSVSTIYNYKVKVKNGALGDRDSFEERVKMIGNIY